MSNIPAPQPMPMPPAEPPAVQPKPTRFSGLAWAALILGIVGMVGSPVLIFNNLTAIAAGVGLVLGIIALFGTKKLVAGIGAVLCVAGIAITVGVQQAAVDELDEELRYQQECANPAALEQGLSDWCAEKIGEAINELDAGQP
ncbi:hypothetical protein [Prauserella flavalba]|uniref:hypothetical protein n=1 Tax=Prauserella flavalba TaxID=1477506 RepID=UPI0036E5DDBA